jgi:hypothetical protein
MSEEGRPDLSEEAIDEANERNEEAERNTDTAQNAYDADPSPENEAALNTAVNAETQTLNETAAASSGFPVEAVQEMNTNAQTDPTKILSDYIDALSDSAQRNKVNVTVNFINDNLYKPSADKVTDMVNQAGGDITSETDIKDTVNKELDKRTDIPEKQKSAIREMMEFLAKAIVLGAVATGIGGLVICSVAESQSGCLETKPGQSSKLSLCGYTYQNLCRPCGVRRKGRAVNCNNQRCGLDSSWQVSLRCKTFAEQFGDFMRGLGGFINNVVKGAASIAKYIKWIILGVVIVVVIVLIIYFANLLFRFLPKKKAEKSAFKFRGKRRL